MRSTVLDSMGEEQHGLQTAKFTGDVEYTEVLPGRPPVRRVVRSRVLESDVKAGMSEIDEARFSGAVRFEEGELTGSGAAARYKVADGVVFLVRWRNTPAKAAGIALRQLHDVQANVLGVAMTLIDMRDHARSGFGDASYYLREYSSYYAG